MKIQVSLAVAAVFVLGAIAPVTTAGAQTSDKAAIQALYRHFNDAFNKKDVNAIMAVYAPDVFVFDVIPPRQYVGAAAYRKDWEDLFAADPGPLHDTVSDLDITVVGPVAYTHCISEGFMTDRNGRRNQMAIRTTDVLRKVNGKWLIVQEHNSVPVDFATGQPDMLSKP